MYKFKNKLTDTSHALVMAIINLTDDSFYAPSRLLADKQGGRMTGSEWRATIDKALREGADIIDLGACSTRPGSVAVSEQTEWDRLQPALEMMREYYPEVPLSVDTFRIGVMKRLATYGIDIINDVSGGSDEIYSLAAESGMTYILTHNAPFNTDEQVIDYFCRRVDKLFRAGVKDVWIDPGFGFQKTPEQNYHILNLLPWIRQTIGLPILVGVSRKSMITSLLDISAEEALCGTVALNTIALMKGADILRVHDVEPAKQVITIQSKVEGSLEFKV